MGEWGNILGSLPYKKKRKNVFNDCPISPACLGTTDIVLLIKSYGGLFKKNIIVESFYYVKYRSSIIMSNVHQIISREMILQK